MVGNTGDAVVVDTVRSFRRLMLGSGVLIAVLGVGVLAFFLVPGIDVVTGVVLGGTSAVLIALGGWLVHQYLGSRNTSVGFVFDSTGFTIRRPAGDVTVAWEDVAEADVLQGPGGAAMGPFYHFRFRPRGDHFAAEHPDLADLREGATYRWNLGPYRGSAKRVIDAVARFQPRLAPEIRRR